MSAFSRAYVKRGPWEMSPVLLLLLLTSLAGIVSGQSAEDDALPPEDYEAGPTDPSLVESSDPEDDTGTSTVESPLVYDNESMTVGYGYEDAFSENGTMEPQEEDLNPTIILVPVVLVVVIIGMIVCGIAISRKWNQKMTASDGVNESYLQASSTEKVPMPMFDDDIPSVLELEMEDMDQWVEKHA